MKTTAMNYFIYSVMPYLYACNTIVFKYTYYFALNIIYMRFIQVYAPVLIVKPSPFADNEADQIRTYATRDTYRQGVFCPSI